MGEDGKVADAAAALKTIHCHAVQESINTSGTNRVLGTPAPAISEEEEQLPKKPRRTFSQLGSGFSASLEDYRHHIGLSANNLHPCYRQEEQSVHHVFECPAYPTDLQPL